MLGRRVATGRSTWGVRLAGRCAGRVAPAVTCPAAAATDQDTQPPSIVVNSKVQASSTTPIAEANSIANSSP
jgi:hypothetical protein